ncbi:MAG: hypothetical protein ACR2LI_02870 [Propionibacteriaceae bacterium]
MLGPTLRLVTHLNVAPAAALSPEVAAHGVIGGDTAHHVLDPDRVLGLDPLFATELQAALPELGRQERVGWLLALPRPGHLAPLRGPVALNQAAVEAGAAAIGCSAGIALVPYGVGRAVQWRVFTAEIPRPALTTYDAERALDHTVRRAARVLMELDVAGGQRPIDLGVITLPSGYDPRRRTAAEKAYRLLRACDSALADEGGALSLFEMDARTQQLRDVRRAAADALCAAVSWEDRSEGNVASG